MFRKNGKAVGEKSCSNSKTHISWKGLKILTSLFFFVPYRLEIHLVRNTDKSSFFTVVALSVSWWFSLRYFWLITRRKNNTNNSNSGSLNLVHLQIFLPEPVSVWILYWSYVITLHQGCSAVSSSPVPRPHQRDLNRLENWTNGNLIKFGKRKYQVLHLGRNQSRHQHRLGANQLENNLADKALGDLVINNVTMSQQQGLRG